MESQKLNKLAEKYWEGACTDREEQQLKNALLQGEVPVEMQDLAAYFRFQEGERTSKTLGATFDEEILKQIEGKKPEKNRTIPLSAEGSREKKSSFWYITRIAASLILIIGLFWFLRDANPDNKIAVQKSEFIDTFKDSEEAYREVKKALMLVSSNMNDGMKHTRKLGEFHKAQEGLRGEGEGARRQGPGERNTRSGEKKNTPESDI